MKPNLGVRALHQQASINSSSVKSAIERSPVEMFAAKQDALRRLISIGSLGLGVGIGGRSLLGLRNMLRDTQVDPYMNSSPIPTPVPIPLRAPHEEEPQPSMLSSLARRLKKQAEAVAPQPGAAQPGMLDGIVNKLAPKLPDISTTHVLGDWWGPSASLATGLGTVGGGWMLTDWLLNKYRQQEAEGDEQAAETDYRKALGEQYQAAMQAKQAGDDLGIDNLYEMIKEAFGWGDAASLPYVLPEAIDHDLAQKMKGVTLAAMMATGLGAGKLTYDWTRKRNQQQLLQKAIKLRARQRQQNTPTPVYAVPDFDDTEDQAYAAA